MIRVAVVDDHPIARRGIEQVLTETGRTQVVASAASTAALADAFAALAAPPDVIVLDLYHDAEAPNLEAVAELASTARVLVMSASGRREDVLGAVKAGAAGYVTKHANPEMFLAAVETVAAGGFALSPQLADILQAELGRVHRPASGGARVAGTQELSVREGEALGLIARGFTHSQVATRMGVTKATVDTYVERIRAKLQVGNKAELTRAALDRMGRIPPP
ncbi:response regulator transcription factor [Streptosporangiaceae bacterium NEAU-GS5]|nr:response regulator transcription factor [Streptosporangiaceae bacterium NEAU-GS5]